MTVNILFYNHLVISPNKWNLLNSDRVLPHWCTVLNGNVGKDILV